MLTFYRTELGHLPILVAVRSKAQVSGRSIAGIAGSNPTEGMGVRLWCLLCKSQPLRRADHSE